MLTLRHRMYVWKVCEALEPRLEDGCLRHRASELLQFADAQRSGTAARLTNQKVGVGGCGSTDRAATVVESRGIRRLENSLQLA